MKSALIYAVITVVSLLPVLGQQTTRGHNEAAYIRVVTERAAKIVEKLGISDPQKLARVQTLIANQYQGLNAIHESWKMALSAPDANNNKAAIEADAASKLTDLHKTYLASLARELTPQQVEQVKDGMTYGVLPITYKGYQAMLPDLTDAQKEQILAYLTEARERAMDEGSSKEKHAMFGKYKGRINNYLSAAGIDMKKASKEWEERIAKEKEAEKLKKS
ncbi:DUF3826 domain-containing protein [Spirosoma sp. SC4-14]|uniref:DUF3826 domain-containing protein n=1 Tax=Spirosoma sp. SC4-14 TaxID=3128900 RepID=UPI0030CDCE26